MVVIIGVCQLQNKGHKSTEVKIVWGNVVGYFILFLVWEGMVKKNFTSKS